MAESSEFLLEPLGTDDFVELVQSCGLAMPRDVLEQLERRRLITPASLNGSDVWTRVHLYLVAVYFDAVTQIRHPWTSMSGGMTVNEVSDLAGDVVEVLEEAADAPREARDALRELGAEIGEFMEGRNPLGELADLLDIGSEKTRAMLAGEGRLFAEMSVIRAALETFGAAETEPANEAPSTEVISEIADEPPTQPTKMPEARLPADEEAEEHADADESVESTLSEKSKTKKSPRPEPAEEPVDASSSDAASEGDRAASDESGGVNVFAENDATEVMNEDELAAVADDASSVEPGDEADNEFARGEGSSVTSRTRDLRSRLDNLRHEDKKVARQRGKDVEVEESEAEDDEEADEMAERIAELNRLREKYLASQQWEKLTELYEEGISLFVEPAERQQVFMTLAMLYEVKLNRLAMALDRFVDAYTEEGGAEESIAKALEGIRRVGRQKANQKKLIGWLEGAVSEVEDPARRAEMQREYALALHSAGEGQRAFYTYTSYLVEAPREQVSSDVLDDLELLSEGVDDEELTEFFRDFIENNLTDDVFAEVAMRAARHAADSGDNETAVEFYETLLDAQPEHEVAFHSLAHLYEDTERWLELYQLYQERLASKGDDAGPALTSELERVEEQLLDHADSITYRLEAAYVSGDESIVDDFAQLYIKHQRFAEGYGFLNKFVEAADDKDALTRAFLALAKIAVRHLHAPEEAALHYERALELGGPEASVLQDLARVRFDSGDWTDALTAVNALMGQADDGLDSDEKVKWLSMGIHAAEKAERDEDRAALARELRAIEPDHELVAGGADE
jgi:tetratricopeptide (TPR) repeat protein